MKDTDLMPTGKHAGEPMVNIPASYLLWIYENNRCSGEVRQYIKDNLDVLKKEYEQQKKANR